MIHRCCCCGKQIVDYQVGRNDEYRTIKAGIVPIGPSLGYACGYCAEDLDENGLFPEERGFYEK